MVAPPRVSVLPSVNLTSIALPGPETRIKVSVPEVRQGLQCCVPLILRDIGLLPTSPTVFSPGKPTQLLELYVSLILREDFYLLPLSERKSRRDSQCP